MASIGYKSRQGSGNAKRSMPTRPKPPPSTLLLDEPPNVEHQFGMSDVMPYQAARKATGRPSLFSEEIADEICDRLAQGEPLAVICRDPHMPAFTTVYQWEKRWPDLSAAIAHARDTGADVIAWRSRKTVRGKTEADGGESSGDVVRDKLIVEHDLKLLAKWNPRYADRRVISGDAENPLVIEHRETLDVSILDPDQREQFRELVMAARANLAINVTPSGGE